MYMETFRDQVRQLVSKMTNLNDMTPQVTQEVDAQILSEIRGQKFYEAIDRELLSQKSNLSAADFRIDWQDPETVQPHKPLKIKVTVTRAMAPTSRIA